MGSNILSLISFVSGKYASQQQSPAYMQKSPVYPPKSPLCTKQSSVNLYKSPSHPFCVHFDRKLVWDTSAGSACDMELEIAEYRPFLLMYRALFVRIWIENAWGIKLQNPHV